MKLAAAAQPVRGPTTTERLAALERRADGHDQIIPPMALQVAEMYEWLTRLKTINWFLVKVSVGVFGFAGFLAAVLTAIGTVMKLLGH